MSKNYNNLRKFISCQIWIFSIFFSVNAYSQIFPGQFPPTGPNSGPGNPDAIVNVNAILQGDTFIVNGQEACITGGGGNNGSPGENPEWRFDILLPNASDVLPVSENIEIRVCRRGDFGQSGEGLRVLDENLNEIGLIPGDQSGINTDCSEGPICLTVTVSSCAFNAQAADGIFSLTLDARNVGGAGGTVGDFCNVPAGPQEDATPGGCGASPNCSFSQVTPVVVNGVTVDGFDNQNNGGPMVNSTAFSANCAFIDYFVFPIGGLAFTIDGVDALDLDGESFCTAESIFIPSASGAGQQFTVSIDGGPRQSIGGGGNNVIYDFVTPGTYEICNIIDPGGCAEERCITLTVVQGPEVSVINMTDEICSDEMYTVTGSSSDFGTVAWTSSGTGVFSSTTVDNPTYTPSDIDITAGTITLTKTVTGQGLCFDVTTEEIITLTISEESTVEAGNDISLCIDFGSYTLVDSTIGGGATTGTWTVTTNPGDGAVSLTTATANPETVNFTATTAGTYVLTLTTNATSPCATVTDTVTITVDEPAVDSIQDLIECFVPGAELDARDGISSLDPDISVVFYDAITNGNIVNNPILDTPGTISYFAEITNTAIPCTNPIREEVVLTLVDPPFPNFTEAVCSGETLNIGVSSVTPSYTVSSSDELNVPAATGRPVASNDNITDTYINTTGNNVIITYSLTVTNPTACAGETFDVIVTVAPEPEISNTLDTTVCSDTPIGVTLEVSSSSIPADAFRLVSINPSVGLVAGGSNAVITSGVSATAIENDVFTNLTNASLTVDYTVQATSSAGCEGQPKTFTITIEPASQVDAGPATASICSDEMYTVTGGTSTNGTILWTTSGSGSFDDDTAENPVYTPSDLDISA
ncbi:PKD-like domain-containing protein, partial [uncultured Dokdonia sp.]|uniref:PKD-like domain-containing protein n=1 Tax=uncultured Dokdonia sp. TaxID=575653 RepID=UPI002637FEA0